MTLLINPSRSINFVLKKFNENSFGLQLHSIFAEQTMCKCLGFYDSVSSARVKAEEIMAERRHKNYDEECIYSGDWI